MTVFSRIIAFVLFTLLFVFLCVYVFRYQHRQSYNLQQQSVTPAVVPESTKTTTSPISIDLETERTCHYASQDLVIDAFIGHGDIQAHISQGNTKNMYLLLSGECLYKWENGTHAGEEYCPFRPIVTQLMSMPLPSLQQANELLASCKKEKFEPSRLVKPKDIIFAKKNPTAFTF